MTPSGLRILVVAPQPFMVERGTPMAVRFLVEALCDLGHQVDLLTYPMGNDIAYPGLRLLRSPRPPLVREVGVGISLGKLACDAWMMPKLFWLLFRQRYDVVHAVEEALFPAALWSALSGTPIVYDMDSCLSEGVTGKWRFLSGFRSLLRWVERWAIRRASLVLPVCPDLAELVMTDISAEAVVVLPDFSVASEPEGVPSNDLRDLLRSGEALALYVGNLGHYQGIELLLEAIALLGRDTPCKFVIVGGPEDARARLMVRAEQLCIADRVILPGPRPVEQLGILMAQADILLSPRLEGVNTPMKVYAYMQSGVALLATDIRSHSQVLDHTNAELVPVTAAGLAAGIRRLLVDPDRRRQIGESARELALREYTPVAYRRRLARAYAWLTARMSPKSAAA